ncbi:MAG: PEP-CTERM sorting domain-containing protein [Planctomycetes bacterium]|nr:PEP-CTERM sorting domain-containing protein [Planctomycetota bacterium]
MPKRFGWILACFVNVVSTTQAQIVSATLDVLSAGDPGAPTPPGVIVLDGFVDVAATDVWTVAGVHCMTYNGATLRYADGDPNEGLQPTVINTGSGNDRFVTLASRPRERDEAARFDNSGVGILSYMHDAGGQASLQPTHCDFSEFASPPPGPSASSVDGWVVRLAIDSAGQDSSSVRLTNVNSPPDAFHPLLLAAVAAHPPPASQYPGWVNATWDVPPPTGQNWYLWGIPEPSTIMLLAAGMACFRNRRHSR